MSQPKKSPLLKIRHKSKVKISAFSETKITKFVNSWSE